MKFFEKPKFDPEKYDDKKESLEDERAFLDKFYTYSHEKEYELRKKIEAEAIARIRKLRGEVENLQQLANKEVEENIEIYKKKRHTAVMALYDLWNFRIDKISTSIDKEKELKDFLSKVDSLVDEHFA
jgi:hypothetical protein